MEKTTAQTGSTSRNEFIRKVFEEANIIALLSIIGLPGLKVVKDEEKHHDYNLSSMKVRLYRDNEDRNSKMLVQVTTGEPTFDMLYDAIYGFGSDCRMRMILFSGESDDSINRDRDSVKKMIDGLNRFGMGVCLCKVEIGPEGLGCSVIVHPSVLPISYKNKAPSKEKFTEAEFWFMHYGPGDLHDDLDEDLEDWECDFDEEFREWVWLNGVETSVKWNEEGAVLCASEMNPDDGYVVSIWEKHMSELAEAFEGCEVKYSVLAGQLPEITVQVWKEPVSYLIGKPQAEKKGYGGLLYAKFHRFSEMIENFVWDLNNGEKVKAVA